MIVAGGRLDSSLRAAAYASDLARRQGALPALAYVQPVPAAGAAEPSDIGMPPAFVVACTAVTVLRHRRPGLPRAFRAPRTPVVPAGVWCPRPC